MYTVKHTIQPVYDADSRVLILGSIPSPKSREAGFFYSHPQNRFWKVISSVLDCPLPTTVEEKRMMLLENRIALWDVVAMCDIEKASDASITNVTVNDIASLIPKTRISVVFTNGSKATELYRRYSERTVGIPTIALPSTSPANAVFSLERLVREYSVIIKYLGDE